MYYSNKLTAPYDVRYDTGTIPVFTQWFGSWQISVRRRVLSMPQLARAYDRAAPGWCRKLDRFGFPDGYEGLLRKIVGSEVPGGADGDFRVLDCGVGTGALSCALARAVAFPFKLDAIDVSRRMLHRARRCLRGEGVEASLRRVDVRKLPYGDGVFDLVMSAHLLEHLDDPGVAIREMVRVLKPGGVIVVCVTRRSAMGLFVHLKWRTHRVTPREAEKWLSESGLSGVRSLKLTRRALCRYMSVACAGRKPIS